MAMVTIKTGLFMWSVLQTAFFVVPLTPETPSRYRNISALPIGSPWSVEVVHGQGGMR